MAGVSASVAPPPPPDVHSDFYRHVFASSPPDGPSLGGNAVLHRFKEALRNFSAYNARWRMPAKESGGIGQYEQEKFR